MPQPYKQPVSCAQRRIQYCVPQHNTRRIQKRKYKSAQPHDKHTHRRMIRGKSKNSRKHQIPPQDSVIAPVQKYRAQNTAQQKIQQIKQQLQDESRYPTARCTAGIAYPAIRHPPAPQSTEPCGQMPAIAVIGRYVRRGRQTCRCGKNPETVVQNAQQNPEQHRFRDGLPFPRGACLHKDCVLGRNAAGRRTHRSRRAKNPPPPAFARDSSE